MTRPCRNTTVRAARGGPRRWTWWRTPPATTSAIEVLRDEAGELGTRVEVEVVAAGQDLEPRAVDHAREPAAGRHARRAVAVREQGRRGDRRERLVGDVGLGAQVGEQRAVEREERQRLD